MYLGNKIGVVVPAFNEEPHIGKVLAGMPDFVDVVYVVDDCSTDRTADFVRRASRVFADSGLRVAGSPPESLVGAGSDRSGLGESVWGDGVSRPHIELLQHPVNRGVGAAIATGYKRCVADGMDIAAVMAGDNQMDPLELPRLLQPIIEGRADYSKGDRTSRPEHLNGMPLLRRLGTFMLCRLTRIAVGNHQVRDPQNGYTAASRELLAALPLEQLYPRYGYCNQLLAWASVQRRRLVEVAMPSRYLGERSKIRYRTYIPRVSWLLLRLLADRLSNTRKEASWARRAVPSVAPHYSPTTAASATS
jgi:glycosyltransferase involved in cell wall biosynthesis